MRGWLSCLSLFLAPILSAQSIPGFFAQLPHGFEIPAKPLPPILPEASKTLKIIHCDSSEYVQDRYTFRGDVVLEYKGYVIKGQKVTGGAKTDVWILEKDAELRGKGDTIKGDRIVANFAEKTFSFTAGKAQLSPASLKGKVTGPLYVTAPNGNGANGHTFVTNADTTTCDLDHPHFLILSKRADIVPNKRAILSQATIYILDRKILTLPWLIIPLDEDSNRFVPEVGQSPDEGYFVKSKYYVPVHGQDSLGTRFDYMTRLGYGIGNDYRYSNKDLAGAISYYMLTGTSRNLLVNSDHQQGFGSGVLTVGTSYQKNNYLTAPDSTLLSLRSQYSVQNRRGSFRLGFNRNDSSSGDFNSVNQNSSLSTNQNWGKGLTSRLDLALNQNNSKNAGISLAKSDRLDLRFGTTEEAKLLTADFLYNRSIKVGGSSDGFSDGSDQTPMVTLRTDASRLTNGRASPEKLQLQFGLGELHDPSINRPITRTQFESSFRRSEFNSDKDAQFNWGARFQQSLYSDNTAQYVVDYDGRLSYLFAKESSLNINYRRFGQTGFTPLAIDAQGRGDAANLDLTYKPSPVLLLSAQTGYDVYQSSQGNVPWQIVSFNSRYTLGPLTRFQLNASYDTYNSVWSAIRADGQFYLGNTKLNIGVRFDASRSVWSAANLTFLNFQTGKVSLDGLLSYNGYTKQVEAQQYELRYDLHCAELIFQYTDTAVGFRSGKQFALFFRIKALPFTNNFGVGQRGQSIGGNPGF